MSKNIVFEGWLTKSPPAKRIWRAKWRRRWFSLRQSSELPGQYFLDYYADRNCRRLKGTIDLDLCEQVDAGLHMERGNGELDPKIRGSGFTIRTQSRTYYLEADSEPDMEKWVNILCRVCGLRSTADDANEDYSAYVPNASTISVVNERFDRTITTGPYIPISECITGSRLKDKQRAFTFDPKTVVTSNRRVSSARGQQMYMSQPHIRLNAEFSEPDSNLSDEDCKSLNASQCNIGEWSVAKSFTKLSVSPKQNGFSEEGPPVPPRPPKTLTMNRESYHKEAFIGPKIQEPVDAIMEDTSQYLRAPQRQTYRSSPSSSPARLPISMTYRYTDDEDENSPGCRSVVYFNLLNLPPAVDRALKPRHAGYSFGYINNLINNNQNFSQNGRMSDDEAKSDVLQYLDLDLHTVKPPASKSQDVTRGQCTVEIHHNKTKSAADTDPYKTVDFVMTEAFNITRRDAEAARSMQMQ